MYKTFIFQFFSFFFADGRPDVDHSESAPLAGGRSWAWPDGRREVIIRARPGGWREVITRARTGGLWEVIALARPGGQRELIALVAGGR